MHTINIVSKNITQMKNNILTFFAVATAILLTGCEKLQIEQEQDILPITAKATLATAETSSKTTPDPIFKDGTNMNFIVVPQKSASVSNTLRTSGNYAETQFKYNLNTGETNQTCTEVVLANASAKAIYPNKKTMVDLYAFYPYQATLFNDAKLITAQEYTIKHDQSAAMNDDFMIATVKGQAPTTATPSAPPMLTFNRLATKLEFTVKGVAAGAPEPNKITITAVKPTIVYDPTVTFNALTKHYVQSANGTAVKFTTKKQTTTAPVTTTYHVIIPAQTFAANAFEIAIYDVANDLISTMTLPNATTFEPGHKYTISTDVSIKDMELTIGTITAWDNITEVDLGEME